MGRFPRLIAFLILIVFQNVVWSQAPEECNYEGTQAQMTACAVRDYSTADKELNQVYKILLESLNSESQKTLREEQRAWLKERDSKCKKEANTWAEGGSMWPMLYNSCLAKHTRARIQQLSEWKK